MRIFVKRQLKPLSVPVQPLTSPVLGGLGHLLSVGLQGGDIRALWHGQHLMPQLLLESNDKCFRLSIPCFL